MAPARTEQGSVLAFLVTTFVVGWSCWAPVLASELRLLTLPGSVVATLVTVGLFSPSIGALTVTARRRGIDGLRDLIAQALHWRVGPQWYVLALLLPVSVRLIGLAVGVSPSAAFSDVLALGAWLSAPLALLTVGLLSSPLGEEVGWRGYLLPRLQRRVDPAAAAVAVGLITCAWHAPLFAMSFMPQSHLPYLLFCVRTLAVAVIAAWLYNRTGSGLLVVILFHAAQNVGPNSVTVRAETGNLVPYVVAAALYLAVALLLLRPLRRSLAWET